MPTQKRLFTAMTPSFCSLTDTKQSLQYTIKTHLSGPPMPKFEANMNYIPPSPPSSMKQCNKSATVKFHMELLLITTTRKQSRSGATPNSMKFKGDYRLEIKCYPPSFKCFVVCPLSCVIFFFTVDSYKTIMKIYIFVFQNSLTEETVVCKERRSAQTNMLFVFGFRPFLNDRGHDSCNSRHKRIRVFSL